MALSQRRKCGGCSEVKKVAGLRGPRGDQRPYCEQCLERIDNAQPTPIDLLAKAAKHCPPDLAEQIAAVVPSLQLA